MWSELFELLKILIFVLAILAAFVLGYKLRRDEPIIKDAFPDDIIDPDEKKESLDGKEILEY